MNYETILVDIDEQNIATLWLNRPEVNNAFNATMIDELIHALEALAENDAIRVLLLRGKGKHFCAGGDLNWMQASADLDYEANRADAEQLGKLMRTLAAFPAPTLAAVQGAAFGGGVGLVACCDMAIATKESLFSLSEVRIGLAPAVISPYVVNAMGARVTRRYALTGERFDGYKAMVHGLVAELYPANNLDAAVAQWCETFKLNSPAAMRASKKLLQKFDQSMPSPLTQELTEDTIARVRVTDEGQEGLRAFLEKRKPNWQEE